MATIEFTLDQYLSRLRSGTLPPQKKQPPTPFDAELKALSVTPEQMIELDRKERLKNPQRGVRVLYDDGETLSVGLERFIKQNPQKVYRPS